MNSQKLHYSLKTESASYSNNKRNGLSPQDNSQEHENAGLLRDVGMGRETIMMMMVVVFRLRLLERSNKRIAGLGIWRLMPKPFFVTV